VNATSSDGPITYQWSWHGAELRAAVGASLTTRATEVADHGSVYTVTVSNAQGSVTSDPARLYVSRNLRTPDVHDLRFQGVGATPFRIAPDQVLYTIAGWDLFEGRTGTPLRLEPGTCSRAFRLFVLPPLAPRLNVLFGRGPVGTGDLEASIQASSSPDSVITSLGLDCSTPMVNLSRIQDVEGSGFELHQLTVAPVDLEATIAAEGASSRVVTALAGLGSDVKLLSYGWAGDQTTAYETAVVNATVTTAGAQAASLAAQGYIVTAMGNDAGGDVYVVGTRVQGELRPRPLRISTDEYFGAEQLLGLGYAIVGFVYDTATSTTTWIGEQ
jgi:hypothetical protein